MYWGGGRTVVPGTVTHVWKVVVETWRRGQRRLCGPQCGRIVFPELLTCVWATVRGARNARLGDREGYHSKIEIEKV